MEDLPALPPSPANNMRSLNVHNAYTVLADMHKHALQALRQELDAPQARLHIETLTQQAFPILVALEGSAVDEGLPTPWIQECAVAMGTLVANLQQAAVTTDDM